MREWRKTHPLNDVQRAKDNCRSYANVYKRRGKIEPQLCEVCGTAVVQMHHDDYNKPLAVRWLCFEHHHEHHLSGAPVVEPNVHRSGITMAELVAKYAAREHNRIVRER